MKNYLLLFFVMCITFVTTFAQDENRPLTEEELKEQIRQQRITGLVNKAESQPVELAADTLFRMLDANLISENERKIQIIESLYNRSDEAKQSIKERNFNQMGDSRGSSKTMTSDLELDQLSIKLKAVEQMLKLDKHRAREMFTAIPPLKLPTLKCEDSMLPDVTRFYATLGSVTEQTFDAEAKEQKQDMYFAGSYIDRISSPLELKPAADMLMKINVSKEVFDFLLNRYITAMGRMSADPRSLAIALRFHNLSGSMKTGLYAREGISSAVSKELINTYRKMVVSSLSERQCADHRFITEAKSDDPNVLPQRTVHQSVAVINDILEHPITVQDIEPNDVGPGSVDYLFWKTPRFAKLILQYHKLRFGDSTTTPLTPLTPEQRRNPEWEHQVTVFRQTLLDLKPEADENEADFFNKKNMLYQVFIEIVRDNENLTTDILLDYGIFLRDAPISRELPAEWLKYADGFRRIPKIWSEERKKRFYETMISSSSERFPIMFELQALIDEKK